MFNTLDPKFLEERMTQLGLFFNAFLGMNQVAKSRLVLTYFASAAADQVSQDKLFQLVEAMKATQGKSTSSKSPQISKSSPPSDMRSQESPMKEESKQTYED